MLSNTFRQELIESGYIHRPLPLHEERSLEAEMCKKEVTAAHVIWDGEQKLPVHSVLGSMERIENGGRLQGASVRVTAPTDHSISVTDLPAGKHPEFHAKIDFQFSGDDWRAYNRLSFWVKPDSPGGRAVHLRVYVVNVGEKPVPDAYYREGQHLYNLVNHQWNQVVWEFEALPRDVVTHLTVKMDADGKDTATGNFFQYDFDEFTLQHVEEAEMEKGWTCTRGRVSYSMSGYHSVGLKTAIANTGAATFTVTDEHGTVVLENNTVLSADTRGHFEILNFTELTKPGLYRIHCGDTVSDPFEIGEKVLETAVWKIINFIFCERCGYPVPGKHGLCHLDVIAEHGGKIMPYGGGWHDAGDMSQQTVQTAEVAEELFELARQVKDDPLLYNRLMEEALWGIEHTLKTRFGDGYRASSVGLGMWTGNLIGDSDDVRTRVHNQAFQNFFCAATEAGAARALKEYDADLAWKCADAAKEDFRFAEERFAEKGIELPIMWEHTLNSGRSQYYAAAGWAAAGICEVTGEAEFAAAAEKWGEKLLLCQETGADSVPMAGFFYRDESHKTIVHFTHQGRDHCFVQALRALCIALPLSKNRSKWENAMKLHGEYLKGLYTLASPYGMIPAGIHSITETEDCETFPLLHLQVDFDKEKPNYTEQLQAGIPLGGGYYVRMFPVWFSFRGNGAIHLAMGKAASVIGSYFKDEALLEIAREQLYWVSGKNPFCQSLMYGEGHRYAQQDANYPGEMTGELPVGIETRDNEDIPYWPAGNNATYKEVWLTPAGRWLSIIADLYPGI